MRRSLSVLCLTVMATLVLSPGAEAARYHHRYYPRAVPRVVIHRVPNTAPVSYPSGAVVGTVAAVGTYNTWWGTSAAASALPASAVGAAAFGGVVAVGTVAAVDAVLQPCRGLHALFDLNHGACMDGEYVGYAPPPARYDEPG